MLSQCSNPQCAGGSSDHGNAKMAGIVKDDYDEPVANVSIRLLPADYNPVKDKKDLLIETVSNADGCFIFDNIDTGKYCLSGEDNDYRGFVINVNIKDSQLIILDSIRLSNPGRIIIPGDQIGLKPGNIAYLKGLAKYCVIDSTGEAYINNVPPGIVSMSGYAPDKKAEIALNPVFDSFLIVPNLTFISTISPSPFFVQDGKVLVDKRDAFCDSLNMFSCVNLLERIPVGYAFRYLWDDGRTSEWSESPLQVYKWNNPGVYRIQAQVRFNGNYYAWSNPVSITVTKKQ